MLKAATLQEAVMKAVEFTYVNGNRLANAESARTDPDFLGFMAKNSFEHIRGDGFRLNIG
jgi:hypothetical protein